MLAYAIRYRIKKIRHFKTGKMRTSGTDQTFQNPIYDTNEDVKQGPILSQENLIYHSGDPSAAKPGTLYSHENPCYQIEDPQDDDTSM